MWEYVMEGFIQKCNFTILPILYSLKYITCTEMNYKGCE